MKSEVRGQKSGGSEPSLAIQLAEDAITLADAFRDCGDWITPNVAHLYAKHLDVITLENAGLLIAGRHDQWGKIYFPGRLVKQQLTTTEDA